MSPLERLQNDVTLRFQRNLDWFVLSRLDGVFVARVNANADRIVNLMHLLTAHLDPAVDMVIEDLRTNTSYTGEALALPEVRESLGRLRLPLASHGGVELSVFTGDDQLTLTPELLLVIYSRSERWPFLLDGLGLRERADMPPADWHPSRERLSPVAELTTSLEAAAQKLGLVVAP